MEAAVVDIISKQVRVASPVQAEEGRKGDNPGPLDNFYTAALQLGRLLICLLNIGVKVLT